MSSQSLTATEYKEMGDSLGKLLDQKLVKDQKLIQEKQMPYYKYTPETDLENRIYPVLEQCTHNNRADLILTGKNSDR